MDAPLRVHVAHFGSPYDTDRILKPALEGKADRLYLMTMRDPDLYAKNFEELCQDVKKSHIPDLRIKRCNFFDFNELMVTNATIIREEQDAGNHIYYNISTGGALLSIASILCCFLFDATPYYCKMDYRTRQVPDNPEILLFPPYKIKPPDPGTIQFLRGIYDIVKSRQSKKISKSECLDVLKSIKTDKFKEKTSSDYNILKYGYLDKLEEQTLITVEKNPRGKVEITRAGEFAIQLFSAWYNL